MYFFLKCPCNVNYSIYKNCQNLDQLIKVCLFLGRNVEMGLFCMHEIHFFTHHLFSYKTLFDNFPHIT